MRHITEEEMMVSVGVVDDATRRMANQRRRKEREQERFERDRLKPQPVKFEPGYQFPEYKKLRARNIAAGKWRDE